MNTATFSKEAPIAVIKGASSSEYLKVTQDKVVRYFFTFSGNTARLESIEIITTSGALLENQIYQADVYHLFNPVDLTVIEDLKKSGFGRLAIGASILRIL